MRIAVIGTGYVGLVTGAGFADFGHEVLCVDIDQTRIAALSKGELPFYEPGLADLVHRNIDATRLRFTSSVADAVANANLAIIAVGTPSLPDGSANLDHVFEAAHSIGEAITGFTVVVTKSTVPVGTCDRVRAIIAKATSHPFAVASNPEFLKQGDAVNDFMRPARVIVGADDPRAADLLRDLYRGMLRTNDRIQITDVRSAELVKYAANCMLATRISFMNELATLCETVGADIELVRKGIGADPRIGNKFLFAGVGFGGSCFGKDLRALSHMGRSLGVPLGVVDAVEAANSRQKRVLAEKVIKHFGGRLDGKRVAIWGLSFKPETDDIRESPALVVIEQLLEAGAHVVAFDPEAMPNVRRQLNDQIELAADPYAAATGADALLLITEWREFRDPDLPRLVSLMRTRVLADGRNVWPQQLALALGFEYFGIGRSRQEQQVR